MKTKNREVSVKLNSRPLKLVYLVRSQEHLFDAIALYTHVWGGGANYMLALPNNQEETQILEDSLQIINPDYILIPTTEELLPNLDKKIPARQLLISRHTVQQHIKGEDLYRFPTGNLNHIINIINAYSPDDINNNKSAIGVVEATSRSDIDTAIQYGLPTKYYHEYLSSHRGAKTFSTPLTIQDNIKLSLVFSGRISLCQLTLVGLSQSWDDLDLNILENNDPETVCLFLSSNQDIAIYTAFWNMRWIYPKNKILLNKEVFLQDISGCIYSIMQGIQSIRALSIFTNSSCDEARNIYHDIKQSLSNIDRDLCVRVQYANLRHTFFTGRLSSDKPNTFTRQIYLDDSVRFTPNSPLGHERQFLFGFDAEVTFSSGVKFSLPNTSAISNLLSNEMERISLAEKHGKAFFRQDSVVRATDKGITGITINGTECRFYIHLDEIFVTHNLKSFGFQMKPNKLTQYAKGFIKKLGGFDEARKLVDQGCLEIISTLNSPKAHEAGLSIKMMKEILGKSLRNAKKVKNILDKCIPEILSSGLVRRGYSLICCHCDLKAWYALDATKEFVECIGCAESFQLQVADISFAYVPNELASRFFNEGGQAVLTTASILYQIDRSALLIFGGDLHGINDEICESRNFAEADLLWLSRNVFAIAECKCRYNKIDNIVEIQDSLNRNLRTASQIGAQVVFLGIYTNLESFDHLFDLIESSLELSSEMNVALHLIVNSNLYLWGKKENKIDQIYIMNSEELLLEYKDYFDDLRKTKSDHCSDFSGFGSPESFKGCIPVSDSQLAVGEKPGSYGGIVGAGKTYNEEILSDWEKDLLAAQTS